ncbi:trimeric intracellular cation channel family protein [Cognatazoarcus halotolerans]|uniref:trimeric intracellular cation channel family protein n=1 Tax=Cognatazoarcus halotolerans TaxID=2686016 RepID=UPI00135B056C|nr:trimeric intracellular cation channel family protein [Cognatazoarcus halotolerans]MBX3679704.1 trimeric intracellular cation channel family protein [Rhodocyclaceae bacterium]MCB1897853.1 trimeric intracellular cation channel family protein [Rhodocyclaceae bacterium]MCP5311747.1 trimeric intracellular cation channel family protein [Zoogloeaceae bacterium]
MHGLETLLYGIGLAGVAVNAASGVLEAGRKPLDLFGMVVIALAAALGGGSLRDLLLDRKVFWIADQTFLITALAAGVLTFAAARRWRLPPNLFMLPDAIGLALFTVSGTQIALAFDAPWLVASMMGVITGVFGGIVRDVLCNEIPLVFSGELYATTSWGGALLLVALLENGVTPGIAALVGGGTVLLLRLLSIRNRWALPTYSARR